MGTWCHDSKREVPRVIKLFNLLALENERIKIVALNKQKKGYFKNYKSFNIKRTPTIIFFKNGKEIGRIIERPSESIEENFFQFVDKNK
jgi:thiol-disulfide isomerase/thioredoxin